ncbi:MAG: pyruvate kinase [Syntrophales bacterium]|jgi:pyruvate kinase|nr:pyruvate kinase [Syntrophales bacterium]MCK9392102.1 pyruvate kinase [Syntrophales bacterium]
MIKRDVKKKTKIVATISDRRCDVPFLTSLYQAGMDAVRLNTAHQTPEGSMKVILNIRAVSDHIAIMVDTKGPEIRTTHISEPIAVKKGDILPFRGDPGGESSRSYVYVSHGAFVDETPIKSHILIDYGDTELLFCIDQDVDFIAHSFPSSEIRKM